MFATTATTDHGDDDDDEVDLQLSLLFDFIFSGPW